ncbi:MAG: acyltransferase family protein [Bacteroidia bacterium]
MSKRLSHLPRLDALRAYAALMVVVAHFMEDLHAPSFPYGGNGVQIFFVISGFLITLILLSQKHESDAPRGKLVRNFIAKRALRLFPAYYLLIAALFLLSFFTGLWLCRDGGALFYFTYSQNILFALDGFQSSLLNHTWSLAVEEQFYLFWPLLLIFIPKRFELSLISAVLIIGIASRFLFELFYSGAGTIKGITFIHFETLGTGALLAWLMYYKKENVLTIFRKHAFWVFPVTLIFTLCVSIWGNGTSMFLALPITLMSLAIVFICVDHSASYLDPFLRPRVLQYLGKISYGIYLYHKPIPFFFTMACTKLHIPLIENKPLLFCIYIVITIGAAMLSWKLIEKPIARLKDKLDL